MVCRRRKPRPLPNNTAPASHATTAVPNALTGGATTQARAAPYPTMEMGCIVRLIRNFATYICQAIEIG